MRLPKIKRLKIVEQITIVLLLSVIIPMVISWLIINNINQQAVRRELKNSAIITANAIKSSMEALSKSNARKLEEISLAMKYMPRKSSQYIYLNDILTSNPNYKHFEIINPSDEEYASLSSDTVLYDVKTRFMTITEKMTDNSYLQAVVDITDFENDLFSILKEDNRQVYIINPNNEVILSHNYNEKDLTDTLKMMPKEIVSGEPIVFGDEKNQPLVYYKLSKPDIMIIVDTTEEIMNTTIIKYRNRIILAFLITAFTIILVVGLYTSYLYVNIRQLMKGIIALSKGSYKRKIRLLTNLFTPYEVVFLATEFNKMVGEIYKSYKQLKQKNHELKVLDEFRSNLIDTVSHEFRTPLTSIKGYTSRLLRTDIEIDEETKVNSLKVIKRQSERLSTMVDDLLVIPDIEGANLKIEKDEVDLHDVIETSSLSVSKYAENTYRINILPNVPTVFADKDRLEQIMINIFENASKYSYPDTPIRVDIMTEGLFVNIIVTNQADYIPKEMLGKLFDKFTRVDDKTTRTTRGTGLGLYIVKGLAESMDGSVKIQSTKDNQFVVTISIPAFRRAPVSV